MMNLSHQDQRHIKGPMLLDLKQQKDKVNENHYCKTLQKLLRPTTSQVHITDIIILLHECAYLYVAHRAHKYENFAFLDH